jgi:hypothetical protein
MDGPRAKPAAMQVDQDTLSVLIFRGPELFDLDIPHPAPLKMNGKSR